MIVCFIYSGSYIHELGNSVSYTKYKQTLRVWASGGQELLSLFKYSTQLIGRPYPMPTKMNDGMMDEQS